ncbi:MAG: Glu/Leu/Phe/Val dehydrogenase [Parcubacteria group bacterium]|nr:Glu/Leu/Phe/Val dehydrogenase [Parcubacteria group bacterium]
MSQVDNVLVRIENAAKTINLDSETLDTLKSFKLVWTCDLEARMDNGILKRFKAIRIWHRSPHVDQPHKGGLRYHQDINEDIMKAHAAEMSLKSWIMGLGWGGAKGGIAIDPTKYSRQELKNITEKLVDEMDERTILGPFRDVPAPDVGTNPEVMNWIRQRYAQRRRSFEDARFAAVVTGKPVGYGFDGIPGRNEATGCGLVAVLEKILEDHKVPINGFNADNVTLAIMGFGNVGSHVAEFVGKQCPSLKIVAVSDVRGGIYNKNGLDVPRLIEYVNSEKSVVGLPGSTPITNDELLEINCDILVPAALENVIKVDNASRVKAKVILEGANGPTTPEADEVLESKNILVIPDILANAGGVTVSFFEWARNVSIKDERVPLSRIDKVLKALQKMITHSVDEVFETARVYRTNLRNAAYITAIKRATPLFKAKHLVD